MTVSLLFVKTLLVVLFLNVFTVSAGPAHLVGTQKNCYLVNNPQGIDHRGEYGFSLAPLGDFNGDGVPDLAVGAWGNNLDNTGNPIGAVIISTINADGTLNTSTRISYGIGGFTGSLARSDRFGNSVANMGDVDGDGGVGIVVGAPGDDDGGTTSTPNC